MDCGLDVATSQEAESIARVDGETPVQGLGPFPLARLMVPYLQRGDGLAEQQRDGAKVGVAAGPEAVAQRVHLLRREPRVLHVAQVRLVVGLPLMQVDEEVLGQLEGDGDEAVQGVEDLVVEVFGKGLDGRLVFFEELGQWLGYAPVICCVRRCFVR